MYKIYRTTFILILALLLPVSVTVAQNAENDIRQLLDDFLWGASVNDAEMHDRFWADDLIYTSSAGERYGKERIMQGMEGAEITDDPALIYTAEDVVIRVFDNMAVVTFTLVGDSPDDQLRFLNSGTLLKRDGEWRVINWHATRKAES